MSDTTAPLARREFNAMHTFGVFMARGDEAALEPLFDEAEALLHLWSERYTRFEPTSVLERLNDAGGGEVSEELAGILRLAEAAWHDTGGRFDIGLGAELVAEGYDRDSDLLPEPTERDLDPERRLELARASTPATGEPTRDAPPLSFDDDGTVRIREGSRLDLGGFVKGWAADRAQELIAQAGCSCLVNLGGDISLFVAEGDPAWPVGLHLPEGEATLEVARGGVATSGQEVRLWHVETDDGAGRLAHHIIDPRTGHSATSDISRLTVIAGSCAEAEIWSKALLLAGSEGARDEATARGLMAVVVGLDQGLTLAGDL
jgi:FAD:protein FMN transferase